MRKATDEPDHSILPAPWLWELIEFTYHHDGMDRRQSYIDLVLFRDGETKRLRFFAPRDLSGLRGLPNSFGLCIKDVSGRQLEGIRVRVCSFEEASSVPSFWAASVIEVPDSDGNDHEGFPAS